MGGDLCGVHRCGRLDHYGSNALSQMPVIRKSANNFIRKRSRLDRFPLVAILLNTLLDINSEELGHCQADPVEFFIATLLGD
jgi:hypothetical protein